MNWQLPRKRTILAWHRWLGIVSALFLLSLAITGLALNHTELLKLDRIPIQHPFFLERYGMADTGTVQAYHIHASDILVHLDGQLFYNDRALASASQPLGIIEGESISVVATATKLIYLSPQGDCIEIIDNHQLPYRTLTAVGTTLDQRPLLISPQGNWTPEDGYWVEFDAYNASYEVATLEAIAPNDSAVQTWLNNFQGSGVSLYRVLLDLHSGRLFGWGGRTVMDLTAVAIILLISSGISAWLRPSPRNHQSGSS